MSGEDFHAFEFDGFQIDTSERLLRRGSEIIALTPKAADTLLALLVNSGKMVDKESLMKTIWPDTFVEEGALVRNISVLRKTLGRSLNDREFIETIPKRGYRFIELAVQTPSPPTAPVTQIKPAP